MTHLAIIPPILEFENYSQETLFPSALIAGKYRLRINDFIKCDWCSIFNTEAFYRLHLGGRGFYFQLCLGTPPRVIGVAHFTEVEPGFFRSPCRGTFGGFEFAHELRVEVLESLIEEVEGLLRAEGASKIQILEAPTSHNHAQSSVLQNVLSRRGYQIGTPELNQALLVQEESLLEKMRYNLRKRVNKCRRESICAAQMDHTCCRAVYDVIAANRAARGFPMTMTYEGISQMLDRFPDRLILFGAHWKGKLIAASICIVVNPRVLYVFYWGDLPGHEELSPVCVLAEAIYAYARQNGFRVIDLGISSIAGVPNYGLMNFKQEMGSFVSVKLTYTKHVPVPPTSKSKALPFIHILEDSA